MLLRNSQEWPLRTNLALTEIYSMSQKAANLVAYNIRKLTATATIDWLTMQANQLAIIVKHNDASVKDISYF